MQTMNTDQQAYYTNSPATGYYLQQGIEPCKFLYSKKILVFFNIDFV